LFMARPQGETYEEEFEDELPEGEGDGGEGGSESPGETEGAPVDPGTEQEVGGGEDVEDFFDPQPPRRETTQQRLDREVAELRRQNADLAARLAPTPSTQPQARAYVPPILQETEEQFQARLALLPPDERMEQRALRAEARQEMRLQQMQFQQQEQSDRVAFDAKCSMDGRYKRWQDRVEAKHAELLRQGTPAPREVILKFLLGEHLLSQAGGKEAKQSAAQRKQRVARQTVRPANAGSDVQVDRRQRGGEREARARRLENMQI
jgi:hypothetical protein